MPHSKNKSKTPKQHRDNALTSQHQKPVLVQLATSLPVTYVGARVPGRGKPKVTANTLYAADGLVVSALSALAGTYVFSANGQFDPNITGGSLQPSGWVSLMSDFNHYTTIRSTISVSYVNNSATPAYLAIIVRDDANPITDTSTVREMPFRGVVCVPGSALAGSMGVLTMNANIAEWSSGKSVLGNPIYRGDAASNPQEQVYFHVVVWGAKLGSEEMYMDVEIKYKAVFSEPRAKTPGMKLVEQMTLNQIHKVMLAEKRLGSKAATAAMQPPDDQELWEKVDKRTAWTAECKRRQNELDEVGLHIDEGRKLLQELKWEKLIEGRASEIARLTQKLALDHGYWDPLVCSVSEEK